MSFLKELIQGKILFLLALGFVTFQAAAQNKKPKFTEIKISGYFRNYLTYRNMMVNYNSPDPQNPNGPLANKTIMINGLYKNLADQTQANGYREPLLMIVFDGKPSANTSFNVDFLLDNQLTGDIINSSTPASTNPHPLNTDSIVGTIDMPRRIQSARWLNFGGEILTPYGSFDVKAGGVLNLNLSQSTLNFYQYRDDMFERYPWEWQTKSFKRYTAFYNDQNLIRDPRLASSSVQGITVKGSQMPFRTGFLLVYGKANNTNIYRSFLENNNQDIFGFQVNKKISTHTFSLNYYCSKLIIEPQSFERNFRNVAKEEIISAEQNLNFEKFAISSEIATGHVSNPVDSAVAWDGMISVKLLTNSSLMKIPIMFNYYYVGANIVNPNSAILNSSNRNVQATFGNDIVYNNNIFEGVLGEFGQLVNNRSCFNLSGSYDAGKSIRMQLALSSSQELENRFDVVTIQHRLNGFNRSQFVYYRNQVGPYQRHMTTWRRMWEKIGITDTARSYKKGFNLIDFSFKIKTQVLGRDLIFSNYINYNSAQDKFSPIALFSNKAFVRSLFEELMVFYNVHNKVTLVGLAGYERTLGNDKTTLAENGKPMDQTGTGFGLGIDYDITNSTGLYLRQRWYNFEDKNFVLDKFRGFDSTIELKIFF